MKRLLLLSLLVPALAAAGVPDEDMILDRTMDAQSAFYYPALMMRYNAGDETLTDEDYHYLYYGYAYRDEYKPLAVNPDLDKMLMLASGIDPDKPDRATLETMVSMGNDALKRDPFSPKILNLMSFAYGALGDKEQEKAWSDRMNGVIRTILGSGDGFTQKTPRHVLMFDHALDVLAAEGLSFGKARIVSPHGGVRAAGRSLCGRGQEAQGILFRFQPRLLEQTGGLHLPARPHVAVQQPQTPHL